MSFHLSKGAPAFSPNNMRLGLLGGTIITSKPAQSKLQPKPKENTSKKSQKQTLEITKEKPEE